MEHSIGSSIIDFRENNNGSLPTRMRSLFSWNINSWRTFDSNEYKLRRCKRLLRKGPVCLQETKWTGAEIEHLYQQIPGIRICHSAAVRCGERARTGGVAVLLPPGWEILEELELVPGRAVAVEVQDRTCQFLLISVYIHPERRKQDAEALLRAWRRLDRTNQFVFLTGDFNGIDTHLPDIWPVAIGSSCFGSSLLERTPFFCLMAAWLNEGRCPGGRPSVSTNYITIEANVFCIEMTTVHAI